MKGHRYPLKMKLHETSLPDPSGRCVAGMARACLLSTPLRSGLRGFLISELGFRISDIFSPIGTPALMASPNREGSFFHGAGCKARGNTDQCRKSEVKTLGAPPIFNDSAKDVAPSHGFESGQIDHVKARAVTFFNSGSALIRSRWGIGWSSHKSLAPYLPVVPLQRDGTTCPELNHFERASRIDARIPGEPSPKGCDTASHGRPGLDGTPCRKDRQQSFQCEMALPGRFTRTLSNLFLPCLCRPKATNPKVSGSHSGGEARWSNTVRFTQGMPCVNDRIHPCGGRKPLCVNQTTTAPRSCPVRGGSRAVPSGMTMPVESGRAASRVKSLGRCGVPGHYSASNTRQRIDQLAVAIRESRVISAHRVSPKPRGRGRRSATGWQTEVGARPGCLRALPMAFLIR